MSTGKNKNTKRNKNQRYSWYDVALCSFPFLRINTQSFAPGIIVIIIEEREEDDDNDEDEERNKVIIQEPLITWQRLVLTNYNLMSALHKILSFQCENIIRIYRRLLTHHVL